VNCTEQQQKYLKNVTGSVCHKLAIAVGETPRCIPAATASHYTCYSSVMFVIRKHRQFNIYGQVGEAAGMALLWLDQGVAGLSFRLFYHSGLLHNSWM